MTQPAIAQRPRPTHTRRQRGVSLLEALVGLTVGLLVVGVALGAVMMLRQAAGTTSEAARLQQQAAYALRIIGAQVRQAGALQLNLAFNQAPPASGLPSIDPADPVAFMTGFDRRNATLGTSASRPLRTGHAFYKEQLTGSSSAPDSLLRDCLGSEPNGSIVQSSFFLQKAAADPTGELRCAGSNPSEGHHALIADVADFKVSWLRQRVVDGVPVIDRVDDATASSDWTKVYAVQVCLEMAGRERIDTGDSTYRPCGWMPGQAQTPRNHRLRLVWRNTFQLRTQGEL